MKKPNPNQSVRQTECRRLFCSNNIYSSSDWRRAMLTKKKELINQGIVYFDIHPEFVNLVRCKSDITDKNDVTVFNTEKECNKTLKRKSKRDVGLDKMAENFGNVPSSAPHSQTKRSKCPKGSRRDKKTKNCVSTSKNSATKRASPSKKQARCPNGTRRDKKTKLCVHK